MQLYISLNKPVFNCIVEDNCLIKVLRRLVATTCLRLTSKSLSKTNSSMCICNYSQQHLTRNNVQSMDKRTTNQLINQSISQSISY